MKNKLADHASSGIPEGWDSNFVHLLLDSLDNLPVSITVLDRKQTCIAQFGSLFRDKALETQSPTGQRAREVFPPLLATRYAEVEKQVLAGETVEFTWEHPSDSATLTLHTLFSPMAGEGKKVTGVIVVVRDLTDAYVAKREAEQRQLQLDQILDQSPLPMMLLRPDGTPYRVNTAHQKLWNLSLEDLAGYNLRTDEQLLAGGLGAQMERAFSGEHMKFPPLFYDSTKINEKSRAIWIRAELSPVRGSDGQVQAVILITSDVTQEYKAQVALAESEARFRSVFENSPDAMIIMDNRKIVDINPATTRIFGYSPEEVRGKDARFVYFSDKSYEEFGKILYTELSRDGTSSSIWRFRGKDGRSLMMETRVVSLPDDIILAIMQDVSEREAAERKLRESEERFRHIFEHFPELLLLAKDETILDINPAGCMKFDVVREEVVGSTFRDYLPSEEHAQRFRTLLGDALEEPSSGKFYFEFPSRFGNTIFMEIAATRLPDDTILISVNDITNRKLAEQALRENEEQFRGLFEHMVEIVGLHELVFDDEGNPVDYRLLDVNPSYETNLNLKREQVVGKLASEIYQTGSAPYLEEYAKTALTGEPQHLDVYFEPMEKHFSISVSRIGKNRFATISSDVTERVKATELLQEREHLLTQAQAIGKLGNWSFELKPSEHMLWSKQMFEIYGLSPEEDPPVPSSLAQYIHPEDRELFRQNVQAQRNRKATEYSFEYRIVTPAGETKHVRHIGTPIYRDGELISVFGTLQDITAEVESIELLRESEMLLSEAQKIARLGSWSTDIFGQNYKMSEELLRILELDVDAGAPSGEEFFNMVHPEDRELLHTYFYDQAYEAGQQYSIRYRLLFPDGRVKHIEHVTQLATDANNVTGRLIGTVQDITEQVVNEEERRKLEIQMLQTQKLESLGVLAGGIAHDFNNILMTILGNADLALSELPSHSPARQNLEDILSASKQAAELTKQMLAYSGKGYFQAVPLDLGQLVNEMANILDVSVSKKTVLQRELAPDLPAVRMDAGQIRQVILNLIINASEAMDDKEGVIKIRTGVCRCISADLASSYIDEELPGGDYVYLEVRDSGTGMAEETLNRLFDPFFTTKFTGRGLGLASVLGIVRGHRGSIQVHSEPGKGSTFTVFLPAVWEHAQNLPERASDAEEWTSEGTLLLVDDEETVLKVGKLMVERFGFEVVTARDGQEALDQLQALLADGVNVRAMILDMTMPRLDGNGVIKELKRREINLPVILSSGYNTSEIAGRFEDGMVASFIQKPYQMTSLRNTLRDVLVSSEK